MRVVLDAPAQAEPLDKRAVLCRQLRFIRPDTDDEVAIVSGYSSSYDGGQGTFVWNSQSTTSIDEGIVFGSGPLGRWRRVWDQRTVNVNWFGVDRTGVLDVTIQMRRAIAACPVGGIVQLGNGTHSVTSQLTCSAHMTIQGMMAGSGGGTHSISTLIRYDGPTNLAVTASIIAMKGGSTLKDLRVGISAGRRMYAGIGFNGPETITTPTAVLFERVGVEGFAGTPSASGSMDYGWTIGVSGSTGNFENIIWERCQVLQTMRAGVLVQTGQPFNLEMRHMVFANYGLTSGLFPGSGSFSFGTAVQWSSNSEPVFGALTMNNPVFSYVAEAINFRYVCNFMSIRDADAEGLLRLITKELSGLSVDTGPINVVGGRYVPTALGTPAYRQDGTVHIPAEDHRFIVNRWGSPLNMVGVNMSVGAGAFSGSRNLHIEVGDNTPVNLTGCSFDTPDPVRRLNTFDLPNGGTHVHGCRYWTTGSYVTLRVPERDGSDCWPFLWVHTGTSRTGSVTLPKTELGTGKSFVGGGFTDYDVWMHPVGHTGSPPDGAFRTHVRSGSLKTTSFDALFDEAPGVGNTVTFNVRIGLRSLWP